MTEQPVDREHMLRYLRERQLKMLCAKRDLLMKKHPHSRAVRNLARQIATLVETMSDLIHSRLLSRKQESIDFSRW